MAKRAAVLENKNVDMELVAKCLARAIVEGDIVNFRSLFLSWSPARKDSTERLESDKYTHFRPRPNQESEMGFRDALKSVKEPATWTHIQREFGEKRPAQLPSDLLLLLADNAVRLGKYSAASQAYELLRIRPKMQQMFLEQACVALDAGQMSKAVKGFRIASGLEYNYSAFPEPLPLVADYQTRSLGLHGEYPERPENTVGFQPVDQFIRTAVAYLLLTPEMTAHLEKHPIEVRIAFLKELIHQMDPTWRDFVEQCKKAIALMRSFGERLQRTMKENVQASGGLKEELEKALGEDPVHVSEALLGRVIPEGEWWQYLKDLAYEHPAAALFVARQVVGEKEILVPRFPLDSPVAQALGLASAV